MSFDEEKAKYNKYMNKYNIENYAKLQIQRSDKNHNLSNSDK